MEVEKLLKPFLNCFAKQKPMEDGLYVEYKKDI
jgi:hypothetical protein